MKEVRMNEIDFTMMKTMMKKVRMNGIDFKIIWEEFCPHLFNYTFAIGVNQINKKEWILFHVYGWQGSDVYEVIRIYPDVFIYTDKKALMNKIKSDMAKYLTESLTRRFRSGVLSLKQIATMAGWNE